MNKNILFLVFIISLVFGSSPERNDQESEKRIKIRSIGSQTTTFPSKSGNSKYDSTESNNDANKVEGEDFSRSLINYENSADALSNVKEVALLNEPKISSFIIVEEKSSIEEVSATISTVNDLNRNIDFFETFSEHLEVNVSKKRKHAHIWDTDFEGEWSLSPVELKQFLVATYFSGFANYINDKYDPKEAVFNGTLFVDRNWPNMINAPRLSSLSIRFQMLAVLSIEIDCSDKYLRKLFINNLFDSERPVFDVSTDTYKSFLSLAIERENPNLEKIDLILKYMPKYMINKPDSKGVRPLELAIIKNDLVLVQKIVEAGADINISTYQAKYTPFMLSIKSNNISIIEYFISTGNVDYFKMLPDGENVLSLIARNFTSDFIQKILIAIANSSTFDSAALVKILFHNLSCSRLIFEILIKEIYKSDKTSKLFIIPILLAKNFLMNNKVNMIKYLHSLNIPMNTLLPYERFHYCRFIHMAAINGQLEMYKLLLSFGISPLELTEKNLSVLEVAYKFNQFFIIEEILNGGVFSGLDKCLERAYASDNFVLIILLIRSSLDLENIHFYSGHNLITKAVAMNKPGILQYLIDKGGLCLHKPDLLGQSIFDMELPENTNRSLKGIINRERKFANQIFKDLLKKSYK